MIIKRDVIECAKIAFNVLTRYDDLVPIMSRFKRRVVSTMNTTEIVEIMKTTK